jgi:mutator protein MutT
MAQKHKAGGVQVLARRPLRLRAHQPDVSARAGLTMPLQIAVGIVWREQDGHRQVLVARRLDSAAHAAGLCEFPGGKAEPGESPQACVAREVLEETGLQVRVGAPYEVIAWSYPERDIEMRAFDCEVLAGQARALESKEVAWIAPRELDARTFPAANQSLIAAIKARHPS